MSTTPNPDGDLPEGYRWATADEAEHWPRVPDIIWVPRSYDAEGKPYTSGEGDLAVPIDAVPIDAHLTDPDPAGGAPIPMMTYDEAISYAIFAINTLQEPSASEDRDVEQFFEYADVTLTTLVDLRDTVRGLPRGTL